jgi:hypothetical protein
MIPDCTLTTACFDLTKYNSTSRDVDKTLENISSLLEVPCYLIIFTDTTLYNAIKNKRDEFNLGVMTHYVVIDVESLDTFKYRDIVNKNRKKFHPTKDERTCAESHLVCSSKFELVLKSIEINPFNTSRFGWVDSNVGVNFSKMCTNYKNNMLLNILHKCNENKFYLQILNVCDKNYILEDKLNEYYSQYRWIVCGCLFITEKDVGIKILNELNNVFIKHTTMGYGHGEEMYYLEILDKYYDEIVRSYGDYQHILNNFANLSIGIDYILEISNRYLNYGYNKECVDCCSKVIQLYDNFDIEMNYNFYFKYLFNMYVSTFYLDREKAKLIVKNIFKLINTTPIMETIYLSNKSFYDAQFCYCM